MEGTWVLQNTPVTMTGEGGECFGPMRFSVSAATLTMKLTASGQISVMGQCRLQLLCFTVMNDTCEFIFKRTSGEGGPGTVYTCCGYGAEEFTSAEEITAASQMTITSVDDATLEARHLWFIEEPSTYKRAP